MEEYEEPSGYVNRPGCVKANPKNNASYLEQCCEAFPEWSDLLRETDRKLEEVVPGYNISQIKEKFWYLRYYIDVPEGTSREDRDTADTITWEAEGKAKPLR